MKHTILALALAATSAHAQFKTGNELLVDMNGSNVDKAVALGYVQGIVDSFDENLFCVPVRTSAGQVTDVTKQYLQLQPKQRHRTAAVLIVVALSEAFPCANKKGGV